MTTSRPVAESRLRLYRFAVVLCGDPVLAGDLLTDVLGRFERVGFVPVSGAGQQDGPAEIVERTAIVSAPGRTP